MASNNAERSGSARTRSGPQSRGVDLCGKARAQSAAGVGMEWGWLLGASWGPQRPLRPSLSSMFSCGLALHLLVLSTNIKEYLLSARPSRQRLLALSFPNKRLSRTLGSAGFLTRPHGRAGRRRWWGSEACAKFEGGRSPEPGS